MDFSPTELQRELAEGTREVLDRHCPPTVVRAAWEKPGANGPDALWSALAELGLPGALVPEGAGGLGLTVSDLLPALLETGRAGVPAPVVETALVAVPLLLAGSGHDELAGRIAAGDAVVTAALAGEPVPWTGSSGHALLLDTAGAARLLAQPAQGAEQLPSVDGSRPLARVDPSAGAAMTADPGAVRAARLRGALGTAAQLVGLAERQLEMTVGYVTQRHQFGVPVGSFQAVKHHLADALLGVRFAEPAVRRAGLAVDADPAAERPDTAMAVSMAKAFASDAADTVSRTAIQCHGAIGYTDEYDLQLYAKRTWALAAAWGTAGEHRAAYGDALGLPPAR
ncbi:acyl-CoA dehydrogenase family protein [Pseudonocardia aurantiaca]|uniref:Acyl-CoA dehydrogenase family protein n=1 Tax=Pseudonocardia aurantiaca TaxID=75290 RepID=A0ABW4FR54_9PSEU